VTRAAGAHAPASGSAPGTASMSIGEVLAQLRPEFPDTTISKLRYLEAEGLVEPQRTAAGYRKYSAGDVARLRYVLTAQRDHYLPLRVIREQLQAVTEASAEGQPAPLGPSGAQPRPPRALVDAAELAGRATDAVRERTDLRLSRAELSEAAGLDDAGLRELEQAGLVQQRNGGFYDGDALAIAQTAAALAQFGVQPRHLRPYRATADREVGLFQQVVAPLVRQRGPEGRAHAEETLRELASLSLRLHAALVQAGLRPTLGG
jgi:DNA-binding transcriptional MerR regulator